MFEHKDPMKIMDKESQMYFDSSFRPARSRRRLNRDACSVGQPADIPSQTDFFGSGLVAPGPHCGDVCARNVVSGAP